MSAFLIVAAMAVSPPVAAPTHTVVPGESLSLIAACELGDPDRMIELIELNAELLSDPDMIQPGWELRLPAGATGDCDEPAATVATTSPTDGADRGTPAPSDKASRHSHGEAKVRASSATPQPSSGTGLKAIRACESGGDYGAVSANGKHRGAYQFDRSTWASVGGTGDPAAASPTEQDQRAAVLQQRRGSSPWPSCG